MKRKVVISMKQPNLNRGNTALFKSVILLRGIFAIGAISPRGESALFQKWIALDAHANHRIIATT